LKKISARITCFLLVFEIIFSLVASNLTFAATLEGFQAGYTFDDSVNLKWDLGGKYHLVERDFSPFEYITGYNGGAVKAYFSLDQSMFSDLSEMTMGFRINFAELEAYSSTKLFYLGDGTETYPYLSLDYSPEDDSVVLRTYDGNKTETLKTYLTYEELNGWTHIAFTYDLVSSKYNIKLYINGTVRAECSSDVSIDRLASSNVNFFSDFVIDELYVSNLALLSDKIEILYSMSLTEFFSYMGGKIYDAVPDKKDETQESEKTTEDNPFIPEHNDKPDISVDEPEEEWTQPTDISKIKYSWLAYTFDNTFDMSRDLNKTTSAIINEFNVTRVLTSDSGGNFGYGLTRRTTAYPSQYLKLNPGLLYQADSFTFCAWVYRECDKEDQYYTYSQMKLLDFTGYGKFEISPFKTTEISEEKLLELFPVTIEPIAATEPVQTTENTVTEEKKENIDLNLTDNCVFEYGLDKNFPSTFNLSKTNLKSVSGKWVHYAVSYSQSGEVKIYVNGTLTDTFQTGVPFSSLQLTNFKILSGSSTLDSSRYFIDEIYIASRVLDGSDIRKIRYYGAKRFTTEVLADPEPDNTEKTEIETVISEENLRPDDTDALEDSYTETSSIEGFVATTFDDTSLIGKDYNNSVTAVIRNASLSQGIKNYGLSLDGISSYIRYPKKILDSATELTISIAYNWAGSTSSSTQKLFDFSKKDSSVSKPSSYLRLDIGNGTDGLKFELNDGSSSVSLSADVNKVGEWVRLTVTLGNGSAKLYVNGALVDSVSTEIMPSDICPNYNYIGKSGIKGDPLFKGVVDEIYISPIALSSQEIQAFEQYGIEPYVPTEVKVEEEDNIDDLWDKIIDGVIIATGILIGIIVIVIIVTIFKK